MITSGIYNYVNILDKAADAANLRNELLTNNIANVSTPNYKRKDLDFESVLQGELAGEKNLSKAVKKANQNLETLDAQVYTDNASLSYRLDGNNVDINTEEARRAENQIKYQSVVDLMNQEFAGYNTVRSSGN